MYFYFIDLFSQTLDTNLSIMSIPPPSYIIVFPLFVLNHIQSSPHRWRPSWIKHFLGFESKQILIYKNVFRISKANSRFCIWFSSHSQILYSFDISCKTIRIQNYVLNWLDQLIKKSNKLSCYLIIFPIFLIKLKLKKPNKRGSYFSPLFDLLCNVMARLTHWRLFALSF